MSLVPPAFVVDKDDPFKGDVFGRKETVEKLSSLVLAEPGPMVMTVSAPWGQGKTVFCQQWQAYLEKEHQTRTIWFNAWEGDHAEDPLLSLLACFRAAVAAEGGEPSDTEDEMQVRFDRAAYDVAGTLGRKWFNTVTLGAFEAGEGAVEEQRRDQAARSPTAWLDDALTEHDERQEVLKRFHAALSAFAALRKGPLVVFVDELDRCRPAYAVGVLEKIKHLFAVPGVVFILAVDREQLGDAATALLGVGEQRAQEYLEKFIHIDFRLPEPDVGSLAEALWRAAGRDSYSPVSEGLVTLRRLAGLLPITARQVERAYFRAEALVKLGEAAQTMPFSVLYTDLMLVEMAYPKHLRTLACGEGAKPLIEELLRRATASDVEHDAGRALASFAGRLASLGPTRHLQELLEPFGEISDAGFEHYFTFEYGAGDRDVNGHALKVYEAFGRARSLLTERGSIRDGVKQVLADIAFTGQFQR